MFFTARLITIILMVSLLSTHYTFSEIKVIESFHEALSQLNNLPSSALVAFDVDEVLIVSQDKICRMYPQKEKEPLKNRYFSSVVQDRTKRRYLNSIAVRDSQHDLVDPISKEIIRDLRERGITVIALTHILTGRYYAIENMEKWRYDQLCELGIYFDDFPSHIFPNINKENIVYASFYKGILATGQSCGKGDALVALLDAMEWHPTHVVMFDDIRGHLENLDKRLGERGIPFSGYHYVHTKVNAERLDEEVVQLQYKTLIEKEIWISDREAKKELQNDQVKMDCSESTITHVSNI